jgi:hypothetical protein
MRSVVITTGIVAVAGGIATILFMPSCDPDCPVQAKPSVIVQVVDKQPNAGAIGSVAAENVWYEWTNEDGETVTKDAECMDDECTEWMLGEGSPGTYAFHATVCGQQYDSTVTLELNDDGCEVDTQMVELPVNACADALSPEIRPPQSEPLDPSQDVTQKVCTLEARASVLVSVVGQVGSHLVSVAPDRAFYEVHEPPTPEHPEHPTKGQHPEHPEHPEHPNSGELPGLCLNEDCSLFAAGFEKTGDFTVGAEVCGEVIKTRATVGKTGNGCHVETQHVQLLADISKCKPALGYAPPAIRPECDGEARMRASAFVLPVTDGGDVWMPYPTEGLTYVHDGVNYEGYCAQKADNGRCTWWVAGFGRTGRFKAFTTACGIETAVSFSVGATEDGCYPETEFVPVFVDTHGCIRSAWPPPVGNPPPSTPAAADQITE